MSVAHKLSASLLYGLGPFAYYPWKIVAYELNGLTYAQAFDHFIREHTDPLNLAFHVICLFFQLAANFAFFSHVNSILVSQFGFSKLSIGGLALSFDGFALLAAALWIAFLLFPRGQKDAPFLAKALSTASIIAAYIHAERFSGWEIEMAAYKWFVVAWTIAVVTGLKNAHTSLKGSAMVAAVLFIKSMLYVWITSNPSLNGVLVPFAAPILGVFAAVNLFVFLVTPPSSTTIILQAVGGHILSGLIDSPTLYLFCCAYTSILLQGEAHATSLEAGHAFQPSEQQLSFDYTHVIYFPNLLFHAVIVGLKKVRVPLVDTLLGAAFYTSGPFAYFPAKVVATELYGVSYQAAIRHFSREHTCPLNLAYHFACLFFQLTTSFAFLDIITPSVVHFMGANEAVAGFIIARRGFAALAGLFWIGFLVLPKGESDAPLVARFASSVAIFAAYLHAHQFDGTQLEFYTYCLFALAWLVGILSDYQDIATTLKATALPIVVLVVKTLVYGYVAAHYGGIYASRTHDILILFLGFNAMVFCATKPSSVTVILQTLSAQILAALLDSKGLYMFSCAYVAILLQGLAHANSGEAGHAYSPSSDQLHFDMAHVAYFPNLLIHATMQRLKMVRPIEA